MKLPTFRKSAPEPPTVGGADWAETLLHQITGGADGHLEAYCTNPVVRRAVDIRALAVSTPSPIVTDAEGNVIDIHSPVDRQFVREIEIQLALHGVAYIYPVRTGANKGVYVIPADRVTPQQSNNFLAPIATYRLNLGSEQRQVFPSDLLVIRTAVKSDGYTPVSPLESCADPIRAFNSALRWNTNLLKNGSRPTTVISVPDLLTPEKRAEFQRAWQNRHSGADNAGSLLLLDKGKTATFEGATPVEMDYANSLVQQTTYIGMALGVNPEMLGSSANACYNTVSESAKNFAVRTVVPELDLIYSALSKWFYPRGDLVLSYDREQVTGLNERPTMAELTACDFLSTDEKRQFYSYAPVKGGDRVLVALGKVPVDEAVDPQMPSELPTDDAEPDDL